MVFLLFGFCNGSLFEVTFQLIFIQKKNLRLNDIAKYARGDKNMGWLTELIQQSKTQDRTKNVLKCIESMNPKKKNYLGNLVASFSRDLVNVNKSDWRVFLQREINCDGVTTPMVLKGLAAVSEAWETVNEADVELWFLQDNKTGRVELFVSFFSLSLLLSTSSCFFLVMNVT